MRKHKISLKRIKKHKMKTKNCEKFRVKHALTDRLKDSAIPYMQRLLNSEKKKNSTKKNINLS